MENIGLLRYFIKIMIYSTKASILIFFTQPRVHAQGCKYSKISIPAIQRDMVKFLKQWEKHKLRLDTIIWWRCIKQLLIAIWTDENLEKKNQRNIH